MTLCNVINNVATRQLIKWQNYRKKIGSSWNLCSVCGKYYCILYTKETQNDKTSAFGWSGILDSLQQLSTWHHKVWKILVFTLDLLHESRIETMTYYWTHVQKKEARTVQKVPNAFQNSEFQWSNIGHFFWKVRKERKGFLQFWDAPLGFKVTATCLSLQECSKKFEYIGGCTFEHYMYQTNSFLLPAIKYTHLIHKYVQAEKRRNWS